MYKIIRSFVSKTAFKVWRMKKSTKIAIGITAAAAAAAAGAYVVKAQQAKKQERSVKSLVVEDAIKRLPIRSSAQESYEEALEQSSRPYVLPDFARNNIGLTEYDDFTDTFILQPKDRFSDFVIFYIHGHNFWSDPSKVHFRFYRKLADALGATLILPVYPKAPTYHVADVHEMLLSRYRYLIGDKEIAPENIIFAGDAAGGGLVLSLLQRLKYQAIAMPGKALLISPWLDITNTNPDMVTVQGTDPLLNIDKLAFQGKEYAGEVDLESPVVSPIYGDLKGLPPMTVITGTHDILCVDSLNLEKIAEAQDLDINVFTFVNQLHFFVGLPIPEAKEALEIIVEEIFGVEDCECGCDEDCECDGEEAPDNNIEDAAETAEADVVVVEPIDADEV
ncbi:MAG TPA: hypothetical protein DEO32_02295 [Ruminococcaceae bacterium]|nr:hypothetical protein [Oscillospiraceae bacterium]